MTEELFTTEVTKGACPYCGYIIEAATGNGPRPPKRGDVSVCIECLNVVMFNDDLTIVKPDPETFAAVRSNTGLWAYIEFVRLTIRNIKEKNNLKPNPPTRWQAGK